MNIYDLSQATEIVELNNIEASEIIGGADDWFENLASQHAQVLDGQAQKIHSLSNQVGNNPSPELSTQLTAESLKFGYLSNSSHTEIASIGSNMETIARKQ